LKKDVIFCLKKTDFCSKKPRQRDSMRYTDETIP
jgi:hypothetical protein